MRRLGMPTQGGSGGKRGHSNMDHWDLTARIKSAGKIRRRSLDRLLAHEGVIEHFASLQSDEFATPRRSHVPTPSKLRRSGKHCPVCLALLQKNRRRSRLRRHCSTCAAHPQLDKICRHCGKERLWQAAGLAACQSCGRHGRATTLIASMT